MRVFKKSAAKVELPLLELRVPATCEEMHVGPLWRFAPKLRVLEAEGEAVARGRRLVEALTVTLTDARSHKLRCLHRLCLWRVELDADQFWHIVRAVKARGTLQLVDFVIPHDSVLAEEDQRRGTTDDRVHVRRVSLGCSWKRAEQPWCPRAAPLLRRLQVAEHVNVVCGAGYRTAQVRRAVRAAVQTQAPAVMLTLALDAMTGSLLYAAQAELQEQLGRTDGRTAFRVLKRLTINVLLGSLDYDERAVRPTVRKVIADVSHTLFHELRIVRSIYLCVSHKSQFGLDLVVPSVLRLLGPEYAPCVGRHRLVDLPQGLFIRVAAEHEPPERPPHADVFKFTEAVELD